jgi:DNA-binding response OmpR family regulator
LDPEAGRRARLVEAVRTAMASRGPGRVPRVLYVEDDTTLRHVVDAALRDDMDIDQAADLQEAKSCLARNRYDLLLLDIGLPDGSGLELLHDLSEAGQSSPPVVIFSADDAGDEVGRIAATQLTKARTTVEEVRTAILIALSKTREVNRNDERS